MKGTPAYMTPEIMSEEKYSKMSDVYAFGFIVYEIITCEEPFENYDIFKLMKKVMYEGYRPSIPKDVPISYKELIEKCWSQKAEERPSFDEIISELKNNIDFITEVIDESEFYDYVDFIDSYQSTFDTSKRTFCFSDFIKQKGRKKIIKPIFLNETFSDEGMFTNSMNDDKDQTNEIETQNINNCDDKEELNNTSPNINENAFIEKQKISENETILVKINESETDSTKIKECKESNTYNLIYPLEYFHKLSNTNQNLVIEAENDSSKLFEVGISLIEGKNDFPIIPSIGLQYIERSVNEKNLDAILYYTKLFIKGKIIPKDLSKAKQYISTINDNRKYLLQGLICYKENKYKEAANYFKKGIMLNDSICMYKYGKLLFNEEKNKKNLNEVFNYFYKSKELGYKKSEYFISAFNSLNKIKKFSKLPLETQLIFTKNNIKNIIKHHDTEFSQFVLCIENTEKVFYNKSLKSSNFYECLNQYKDILIEVYYPPEYNLDDH